MFGTILLVLLGLLALFCVWRLTRSYKVAVTMKTDSKIASIVSEMKSIKKNYKPTPWLVGGNAMTIWGMRYRGRSSVRPRREELIFEDGGAVYIDWFENQDTPANAPVLVVVHTLGGGTREPCTNYMCVAAQKHGWRAVVATCRGCNGSRITTKRLYDALRTDDLHFIIEHVKKTYNPPHIYLMGFSLGSIISVQYGIDFTDVDAIMCVSHPLETEKCCKILEQPVQSKLYLPIIMHQLKRAVEKDEFVPEDMKKATLKSKTLVEFDNAFTSQIIDLKDAHEYYEKIHLRTKIDKVRVPLIIFNSDDDPFTRPEFAPKDLIVNSNFVAYLSTPEGGHVSFNYGMNGHGSYIENVAIDFFESATRSNSK
ncbi:Clan SC, family S33, methylesterase-like serine peptidase [Trichomonas vaginalis G3]|uniref:Clan SC, family S33, methylesterase-like serine peptidase n=1 Tax=Trichomonas vaginalis (strain ATCC PRA-98 / G3) TaxID=412133 RepID=A2F7U4_TRIV3|nr:acylglycerol lipase protein [Trichomonas vaginalis G3]EAX99023.1 Clan SC, family S33, methylesterase-like serine peptidase [Trichomonas vaginalis G3]KAI5539497.1 acylglycerol lipase protein [Trichomonas vaginalis G3]|eukprot:XP_001311953.1 Clan SC, family S33, methylesterase-like serine peptidase [Trichomonas vaginalis G3]